MEVPDKGKQIDLFRDLDLYDWSGDQKQTLTENGEKPRTGTLVTCNDKKIALFRFGAEIYAIDEKCPHMGEYLSTRYFKS